MILSAIARCQNVHERQLLLDRLRFAGVKPIIDGLTVTVSLGVPEGAWNLYFTNIYEIVMDAVEDVSDHEIQFTP